MRRMVVLLIGVVAVALIATQLALPAIVERRAEKRLEQGGGSADVKVKAFPALRLLFGDGDRFEADGRGLTVDVSRARGDLSDLDGFDEVRLRLTELTAGPMEVREFVLTRPEDAPAYDLRMSGATTPRDVAGFLGSQAGGALGGLFGGLAAGGLPGGGAARVPVRLAAKVESRDGRPEVTAANGTIAGIPAGPFAELMVAAIVARI